MDVVVVDLWVTVETRIIAMAHSLVGSPTPKSLPVSPANPTPSAAPVSSALGTINEAGTSMSPYSESYYNSLADVAL